VSAFLLILVAIFSRILPHAFGFTAAGGSLLYFGARRPLREAFVPVALFAATDYYLTTFVYGYPFHVQHYLLTWTWYAAAIVLGSILLKQGVTFLRAGSAVVLSSTSFFLISNYAVWASSLPMYPHSAAGLMACFEAALPFYRNDVVSTALVLGVMFGIPAAVRQFLPEGNRATV